jgi:hypothetical protein
MGKLSPKGWPKGNVARMNNVNNCIIMNKINKPRIEPLYITYV